MSKEHVWEKKLFQDKDLVATFGCQSCKDIPKRVYMDEKDLIYCKPCINKLKKENKIKTIKFDNGDTNTMEQIMLDSLFVLYCPNNADDFLEKNKNKKNKKNNNNAIAAQQGGAVAFGTAQGPPAPYLEGREGAEGGGNNDNDDDDVKNDVLGDHTDEKDDGYCYDFCNKQLSGLMDHLNNECKIKIVSCPFVKINKCQVVNVKKNQLTKHLNQEKVGHLTLLIELINENRKTMENIKDLQKECNNLLTEYTKESNVNKKEYESIKKQILEIKKDQNIEEDEDDIEIEIKDDNNDNDEKGDEKKEDNINKNDNNDVYKYEETLVLLKDMFPDKTDNELKKEIDKAEGDAQIAMNALF